VVFFLAFEYVVDGDEHLAGYGGDGFLMSASSGDTEVERSEFRVEA
jgi:hypothetical protein